MKRGRLSGFPPIVGPDPRVLLLGSMPGPEALKKRQYYGFPGNQFWFIMGRVLGGAAPEGYSDKVRLLTKSGVALWDVIGSCERSGALDSAIRRPRLNPVDRLLDRNPTIRAVFLNGRTAEKLFLAGFENRVLVPWYYLPSTSPAHAGMGRAEKIRRWRGIRRFLKKRGD